MSARIPIVFLGVLTGCVKIARPPIPCISQFELLQLLEPCEPAKDGKLKLQFCVIFWEGARLLRQNRKIHANFNFLDFFPH